MVSAQQDSVLLEAVEVIDVYGTATQRTSLDSVVLRLYQGSDLGDALQGSSGLYLRQYGAEGQLTSVSFRGTTPSQTQVTWHGVDINSQTLGQSDFSSIPMFLFSNVELHHGAGSTLYGSGAVGGVVSLGSRPWPQGVGGQFAQQLGSYGKMLTGIKGQVGTKKWGVRISGVHQQINNDFEVSFRGQTYKQNNAASRLMGSMFESYWLTDQNSKWTATAWYNYHHREIQPIIGDLNGDDQLRDVNLRTNLGFEKSYDQGFLKITAAYVADRQTYNEGSQTNLTRLITSSEYEFLNFEKISIRTGANLTYAVPEVSSFEVGTTQVRADWFLFSQWKPTARVVIGGNLRVPYMQTQHEVPLVPSLGVDVEFVSQKILSLGTEVQLARTFRFPTLNDLYWSPGGNKDLVPEDGWSLEGGVKWRYVGALTLSGRTSVYHSVISDMIIWQPSGSFWSPQNESQVNVLGAETNVELSRQHPWGQWSVVGNYAWNRSDLLPRRDQLPYVPFHKWTVVGSMIYHHWFGIVQQAHTGKRYTATDNTTELSSYNLTQIELGKNLLLADHQVSLSFQVKNLWDVAYYNYELRATPGRNYLLKLNYQITKNL